MPGLLNGKQSEALQAGITPPAGTAADAGVQTGTAADAGAEGEVTADEQGQYTEFVTNGMRLLHDEGGLKKTLEAIAGDGDPIEGLANVVAGIVMRVEDSATQSGAEISGDVLMQGGTELLEQAAELAEEADIHDFSEEELGQAHQQAMHLYMATRQQQGKLPPEKFAQDLQELQAAEQDGSLETMIPGIAEFAEQQVAKASQAKPAAAAKPSRGLLR